VILDVPLEIEDVALRRSIVAQSNFVSAFQTHHVFNELRNGTLARLSYVQTHERQPVAASGFPITPTFRASWSICCGAIMRRLH